MKTLHLECNDPVSADALLSALLWVMEDARKRRFLDTILSLDVSDRFEANLSDTFNGIDALLLPECVKTTVKLICMRVKAPLRGKELGAVIGVCYALFLLAPDHITGSYPLPADDSPVSSAGMALLTYYVKNEGPIPLIPEGAVVGGSDGIRAYLGCTPD